MFDLKKIPLIECFGPVIQGEGAVIGQQTYFLRFGGCDFRCTKCDSMHAVDPALVHLNAMWLTQGKIFELLQETRFKKYPRSTKWVTLSGGNPCIHDLSRLVKSLKHDNWKIAVETQGTIWQDWLKECDVVTISPKGPGMIEDFDEPVFEAFMDQAEDLIPDCFNLKVVIFDEADIRFAEHIFYLHSCPEKFYLSQGNPYPPTPHKSPQRGDLPPSDAVIRERLRHNYIDLFDKIKDHPRLSQVKFLPQLHVWVHANKQGV
jgi:7-carboxy-7-deazaguanine synthase